MRQPDYTRRVVVTGLGVISPVGNDKDTAWQQPRQRRVRPARDHQVRHDAVHPQDRGRGQRLRGRPTGWTPRPSAAASPPCGTASPPPSRPSRTPGSRSRTPTARTSASCSAPGAGGQTLMIDNWHVLDEKGPGRVAPTFIANGLVDSTSGMIAIETGAIGHNMCVVTACSTGTNCVGEGAELIRRGDVHTVIAGSSEMPLLEVAHAGFGNMRGLGSPRRGRAAGRHQPPVRPDAGRVRPRRGRRRPHPRGPRDRHGPRRTDLRGGRGLRLRGRRLRHDPAHRARRRLRAGDAGGAPAPRRPGGRGRRHQPARDLHAGRRQARGRGDLGGLRRPASAASASRSRSAAPSR